MNNIININFRSHIDEEGYSVIITFTAPIKSKYRFTKWSNQVKEYYKGYFGNNEKYSWGRSSDKYDCWLTACFTIPVEEGNFRGNALKDSITRRTYRIVTILQNSYPYIGVDEKDFQKLKQKEMEAILRRG